MRGALAAALAALLALPAPARPASGAAGEDLPPRPGSGAGSDLTPEHLRAIGRGLDRLAALAEDDGSFPCTPSAMGGGRGREGGGSSDGKTAVTALATLAFLGAGHGLQRGPYHDKVERAVDWLLRAQEPPGPAAAAGSDARGYVSFTGDGLSRMHGHGFATLALAEACGTAGASGLKAEPGGRRAQAERARAERLKLGVQAAVDLIERSQSNSGGWGYMPANRGGPEHEGSITVCQVQALQAASNRGFRVTLARIQYAREYMRRSQDPEGGGVKYRVSEEGFGSATYALTAAGVVSLFGLGEVDRKVAIDRGIRYLERQPFPRRGRTPYFHYAAFYATQAFHRYDEGARWERFWVPMRRDLLNQQDGTGAWTGHDGVADLGPVYTTALSLLMLEVPVGYLSIFAR